MSNENNEANDDVIKEGPRLGFWWYVVLCLYLNLLIYTGWITFGSNNVYATTPDILSKLDQVSTPVMFDVFADGLRHEAENFEEINQLASQSFNVVLGAVLGYLAVTATILKKQEGSKS